MAISLKNIKDELVEEHRLLKELVRKSSDTTNLVLGIVGVVLGLAGLVALCMAFIADKKISAIKAHTMKLVEQL